MFTTGLIESSDDIHKTEEPVINNENYINLVANWKTVDKTIELNNVFNDGKDVDLCNKRAQQCQGPRKNSKRIVVPTKATMIRVTVKGITNTTKTTTATSMSSRHKASLPRAVIISFSLFFAIFIFLSLTIILSDSDRLQDAVSPNSSRRSSQNESELVPERLFHNAQLVFTTTATTPTWGTRRETKTTTTITVTNSERLLVSITDSVGDTNFPHSADGSLTKPRPFSIRADKLLQYNRCTCLPVSVPDIRLSLYPLSPSLSSFSPSLLPPFSATRLSPVSSSSGNAQFLSLSQGIKCFCHQRRQKRTSDTTATEPIGELFIVLEMPFSSSNDLPHHHLSTSPIGDSIGNNVHKSEPLSGSFVEGVRISVSKRSLLQWEDSTLSWHTILTLIVPYGIIFLLSVIGNSLVIATLTLNRSMRSVTNIFLLNLAIADLLLGVFCMPFTLIGVLLRRFIFGTLMCHLVSYFQAVSVAVSVWTLVAMSVERYYAICHPLRSRESRQNRKHAYRMLFIVWAMCGTVCLPTAIVSRLQRIPNTGHYKCREDWFSFRYKEAFTIFLDLFLLIVPLIAMIATYSSIAVTLAQNIPHSQYSGAKTKNRKGKSGRVRKSQSFSDTDYSTATVFPGQHSEISSYSSCTATNISTYKHLTVHHSPINEPGAHRTFLKIPIKSFRRSKPKTKLTLTKAPEVIPQTIDVCEISPNPQQSTSGLGHRSPSNHLPTPTEVAASGTSPPTGHQTPTSTHECSIKPQASLELPYTPTFVPPIANPKVNNIPTLRVNSSQCQMQARQRRIVWMLCVVVIEFFICWTPIFIVDTLTLYWPETVYGHSQALSKWIGIDIISACHLLCFCSSCTNPLTYCFMNNRFRRHFLALFLRCRKSSPTNVGTARGPTLTSSRLRTHSQLSDRNCSPRVSTNISFNHIHMQELHSTLSCEPEGDAPNTSI